ncbi:MAG: universal stress protein [Deltaproteobacteria bacterium]|nr:universal stress protein [Deltaproteobacteria bacterium]
MFNKILFATTASPSCDHAARVAFDIAKRYDAELIAFHVLCIPSRGFSQYVQDVRTGEKVSYDDDYIQWVEEEIKNTYAKQLDDYANCKIKALPGIPHTEILRAARKNDVDLIIMGASAQQKEEDDEESFVYRSIVGRTLQGVAKSARCPVLVISRPAASFWGGFSNIVFGTDFSKSADSAFLFAYNLAKVLDCTLHIFHALDISSVHTEKLKEQDEIEEQLRDARNKIRKKYLSNIKDFKNYEIEVWEGIPYVEIVKFAREKFADLIVMAHHTKISDPEKALLGSTMEQVVLRASCPVASVNHPDKVTNI